MYKPLKGHSLRFYGWSCVAFSFKSDKECQGDIRTEALELSWYYENKLVEDLPQMYNFDKENWASIKKLFVKKKNRKKQSGDRCLVESRVEVRAIVKREKRERKQATSEQEERDRARQQASRAEMKLAATKEERSAW